MVVFPDEFDEVGDEDVMRLEKVDNDGPGDRGEGRDEVEDEEGIGSFEDEVREEKG